MKQTANESVFIAGCGDIGCRVGRLEREAGRQVIALARSDSASSALLGCGFDVVRGDLDEPSSLRDVPGHAAVLYYFAPPAPVGLGDSRLAHLLAALDGAGRPARVVYLGTSGVYGDCGGAWVDEDWPLNPVTERSRRRMAAELFIRAWCGERGVTHVLLRVPGIYGPGRLPVERIRREVPVVRPEEAPFSNRIHADDLAAACVAAARLGRPGQAYNISDGHPTTMTDYFHRVADALHLPRPPEVTMGEARRIFSPGMLSFLEEPKRLDNRRMLDELRVRLKYPDLVTGLEASIRPEDRATP